MFAPDEAGQHAAKLTELADDPNKTAAYKAIQAHADQLTPEQLLAVQAELERVVENRNPEQMTVACWFCAADNRPNYRTCGFCNHRAEDGPTR